MNGERGGIYHAANGRYARISPAPGRGSKIAYMPCPLDDGATLGYPVEEMPDSMTNCIAIPMSSIQTTAATDPLAAGRMTLKKGKWPKEDQKQSGE